MVKVDRVKDFEVDGNKLIITIDWDSGYEFVDNRKIKVCPETRKLEIDKKLLMQLVRELRNQLFFISSMRQL